MAIAPETIAVLGKQVAYSQVNMPAYLTGEYIVNDADDHQWKVDGRGKGRLTVALDNPADNTLTVVIYGLHAEDGAIGDVGTFLIGSFTVTTGGAKGYETINDPFPWYLIQVTAASADGAVPVATVYIDFSAY